MWLYSMTGTSNFLPFGVVILIAWTIWHYSLSGYVWYWWLLASFGISLVRVMFDWHWHCGHMMEVVEMRDGCVEMLGRQMSISVLLIAGKRDRVDKHTLGQGMSDPTGWLTHCPLHMPTLTLNYIRHGNLVKIIKTTVIRFILVSWFQFGIFL